MRSTEHKRRLADYFKKNIKKGYTTEALKWALIGQGYSRVMVEDSIEIANRELAAEAPVIKERPVISHEIYDENDKLVKSSGKSFWKRFVELFKGKD